MAWIWTAPGFADTRNLAKADGERHGRLFFPLKELLVAAGWTVIGSGDGNTRFAYDGETAALPPAEQGTGGVFDCWLDDTGAIGGDGNASHADAWVVLRNTAGRELLLSGTDQTGGTDDGFGRIIWSDLDQFDGSTADEATIPGAAGDEQELYGTRAAPAGVELVPTAGAATIHVGAFDAPVEGEWPFYWATITAAGARHLLLFHGALQLARPWDVSPYFFILAIDGLSIATWEKKGLSAERWYTNANFITALGFAGAFWGDLSNDDPETGEIPLGDLPLLGQAGVATEEHSRGVLTDVLVRAVSVDDAATSADYPKLTPIDARSMTWLHWNQIAIPWHRGTVSIPTPAGGTPGETKIDFVRLFDLQQVDEVPSVSGIVPSPGTDLDPEQPIQFDVTDAEGTFAKILVSVFFGDSGVEEVVHDSAEFNGNYVQTSTRILIAGGVRYTILRTGGWLENAVTLKVVAIDSSGNVATS